MRHRTSLGIAAIAALLAAHAAGANGLDRLAPPGPCAEPETALRGDPPQGFDVAGGPREHFDPNDVAAPGGADPFVPPSPPTVDRSSCDGPSVGCANVVVIGRGVISEPGPGDGGGPVFGGGQQR
ncbi:MAG: hypothetical protein ACQGVC_03025 [Myxococcota bacterium]